ncbi:hypothetical protein ZYGR_0S01090 [Zygosaccharomyces rouxii]|uniref:DNA helicase n=2 Tax=Zygosaccharomyces rouxii TaxID=4956 RepID=C5DXG7_ZYGRC|nr:uncharacterized protein ZYRO0F04906g [Zygosaccharomyces rouxii]KAH9199239.1 P-loop containing nucleoside triphosphate hydrolase protein [Zygosaccharomyces rouxii]GAV49976.1 hypothetical protein ZYGR_0S01090 [Zygosaccharomyces rouxii]CAR28478.1 ZYRO0F04906p [Zygosaccharomyces rouxii]
MVKARLHSPPNGIGAGENPKLVPRSLNIQGSFAELTKPFKVPYKNNNKRNVENDNSVRRTRRRTGISYAGMDVDVDMSMNNVEEEEEEEERRVRADALSAHRLAQDPQRLSKIENTLRRSFTVPIKGYTQRHSLPLTLGTKKKVIPEPRPLHDPTDEFAIVLYDPTVDGDMERNDSLPVAPPSSSDSNSQTQINRVQLMTNGVRNKSLKELLGETETQSKKFPNIPVVIDPKLAKILRPHQVEGVRFLYRCVTGLVMKDFLDKELVTKGVENTTQEVNRGAYGCIMADEMGLGKTLQCIALMWTLLRQGPQGKRLIDKCIIVCPSSLVNNWANELDKWLGPGTLSPLAIDGKKSSLNNGSVSGAIHSWAQAQGRNIVKPVLIISYETLRRNTDQLKNCNVGLMLADEGHRLKNADSLTFTSLDSIDCSRRVILSGTPIQNDLSEYFALLNFSNPGLLGSRSEFRKNFEIPILKSRDADATDEDVRKGQEKLSQLSYVVSKFIIRRTNDILAKYLPCKYEHVIFVNLTPFQRELYKKNVESRDVKKLVKGVGGTQPLKAIGLLKKLCNHPDLVDFNEEIENLDEISIPDDYEWNSKRKDLQVKYSSKFSILERFLAKIRSESDDKIVIISNYTQTLDLIEKLCRQKRYGSVRLDGTMGINKRQKLVDRFNDPEGQEFVFLLSSKAGGCGINLIGANRLILLDPDWNPAADQQALARVWRDGQKKDCFIYRFISTGSIEEKIYQRQSMKLSLSSCVVDAKEDVERLFSADNLKQLFQFNDKTICETHETYHCKRCNKDGKQMARSQAMLYGDATTWNHLIHKDLEKTNDHLLRNEFNHKDISYVFQYISH